MDAMSTSSQPSGTSFTRHGAVDLSALKASTPPAGAGSYVIEVTEQSFDAEVVRRSLNYPVVVEFYSPRVSTGQQLSDALAAAATEAAGKFLVARLNVDQAQSIVAQLRLSAVPTVVGVLSGQLVPLFTGVLPADQVKLALDELVKAAVANGVVGRAEPVGGSDSDAAVEDAPDPRFAEADEALERGDFDAAVAEFDRLLAANPGDAEAKAGRAQAALLARAVALDGPAVLRAAAAPNAPVETVLQAADVEMVHGRIDDAFARLLRAVRSRSGEDKDAARLRLLEYFETLGNADPRVPKARRDLMAALF